MNKSLLAIHQDVPADHYDTGIKNNLFQRFWHLRRFREVLKEAPQIEGNILDIGCHGGLFTEIIAKKVNQSNFYGVDISSQAVMLAQKRLPKGKFLVADAIKLPFRKDFFNAIYCLEVLEHLDDPLLALIEIRRILKKKGVGIILVPTENLLFRVVWFLWTLKYPVWCHAHVQTFYKNQLEQILEKLGFKVLKMKMFNLNMLKLIIFEK